MWLTIQLAFAIICCCLPTYRPILPSRTFLSSFKSRYASLLERRSQPSAASSKQTGQEVTYNSNGSRSRYKQYDNLSDGGVDRLGLTHATDAVAVAGVGRESQSIAGKDFPMNAINVKSQVDVV